MDRSQELNSVLGFETALNARVYAEMTLNSGTKKSLKYSVHLTSVPQTLNNKIRVHPVMWVWNPTREVLMRGDSISTTTLRPDHYVSQGQ